MKVAVLGAGGVGLATSALLVKRAHSPTLWSPSGRLNQDFTPQNPLTSTGVLVGAAA